MDNNSTILIANRSVGTLGYDLPELRISRFFEPKEVKEITFEELHALYQTSGGRVLVEECLSINDKEALRALNLEVEPEYFYTEAEVKNIMLNGSLEEFLDMIDFGPDGVKEIIKNLAVSLPLNDVAKRDAIFEKLNFNVTKAIEIQNTKFDGGDEDTTAKETGKMRRVSSKIEGSNEASNQTRRVVRK